MLDVEKNYAGSRRDEIIDVATEMFLEHGFAGTSMAKLAEAIGIKKASFYHHFASKDDLFAACVPHGYGDALSRVQDVIASKGDPETKLRQAIDILYDTTISSPVGRMSHLIAEVSRTFPGVARAFHEGYVAKQRALISEIVREGVASGTFKQMEERLLMHMLMGPIVTLSLSREMFIQFDDLDSHFPIEVLRDGHKDLLAFILTHVQKDKVDEFR